jgi:hypothetical protein
MADELAGFMGGPGAESDPALVTSGPDRDTVHGTSEGSPFAGLGPLLEQADPEKVRDAIVAELKAQAPKRKRNRAEWQRNTLWLKGVRGVQLRRLSEDRNDVQLVVPLGAYSVPPVMDRTDELLEKLVSHLLADPPVPNAEPATDSDADREAAEFTTRLLTVEGSESGYNNLAVVRRALRKAGVYGSGFVYARVDPQGNGWQPMTVKAHPMAQSEQDALLDPATGMDADPSMLVERYVTEEGALTDDATQAARQWLPKVVPEVLTGEQVVLLPETCSGVSDAEGAVLIRWTTLGQLKAQFPEVASLPEDELRAITEWRPEDVRHARKGAGIGVVPARDASAGADEEGKVKDSAPCVTLCLHYRSHGRYPKGAYIVVCGSDKLPVLYREPWCGLVETQDGALTEECLPLPLAQFRQLDDDVGDDPLGRGIVEKLGPADEVRGQIVLAWLDHLDRVNAPNTLIPLGSIITADDWNRRDGTPLYFNPQGQPTQEKIDAFPADGKEFFDRATQAQDSASGLEATAQGAESAQSQSGIAKQIVVQQSHINLATLRANTADGQERLWRIVAQLWRVFFTIPQKLKLEGDDGAYRVREWSRADLGSTRDIKIARGSFTQQSPEAKQQVLDLRLQAQALDREEYDRLSANNLRPVIGWQDNPHRLRVKRQLSAWREGPPEGWAEQQQAIQQQMQQQMQMAQQQAAMTGMPPAPMQPPVDPANPFADVRPVDDEPDVARIRWLELRREAAGTALEKKPEPWRGYLVAAYDRARRAAGIVTLAEQQQAAQQQAQMQAQQAQAQQASRDAQQVSQEERKMAEQAQAKDADRAFQQQMQDSKQRHELTRDAMAAQGDPMMQAVQQVGQ